MSHNVSGNSGTWKLDYAWPRDGEEWSQAWGNSAAQWHFSMRPRVGRLLPAPTILEIASGRGRWTQYLLSDCERFVGIDIDPACIEHCRRRFANVDHAEFHANDGRSLGVLGDGSIDLVFSMDSLVHCPFDVIEGYIYEILRVLGQRGVAFIHHSNLAAVGPSKNTHGRADDVSAERVREVILAADAAVMAQEMINWGSQPDLIDCLTMFGHQRLVEPAIFENPRFMDEAHNIKRAHHAYFGEGLYS